MDNKKLKSIGIWIWVFFALLIMISILATTILSWVMLGFSISMYNEAIKYPVYDYDYEDYYIRDLYLDSLLDPFDFIMPIFMTWITWFVWKPVLEIFIKR